MGEDFYHDPWARARVAELVQQSKVELVDLAPDVRARASRATLAKWRNEELAWTIAAGESAPADEST